ncbi:MAG TPA: TonB-dependent receptor [Gemmatimonadales bacterium]
MKRFGVLLLCLSLPVRVGTAQDVGQPTGTIAGTVTSQETGAPLAGAGVTVVGTRLEGATGADGRYTIANVPPGAYRVRARLIGYSSTVDTGVVVVAGQTATADLALQQQAVQLETVVAIGYGTVQKRDLTGSVASVRGEDVLLKAAPTSAVSNALQGKAAGVQVVVNSGIPGSGASVRVRGTASISANSEPLYVVDGLPAMQGTNSDDPTYNPLNEINPGDIESVEILKDASATAVYGSRGANGVVLITTKRGQRGHDRVTLESSYGMQDISKRIPVLTGPQYMTLVNEAYVNGGRTARYTPQQIASAQTYNYPNMLLRTAAQQNHALTLSGGDAKTRYLLSGNYLTQDGIIIHSGFERYGLRFNLDREMSDRFRAGTNLSVARVKQSIDWTENGAIGASARGILAAMNFDPSLPPKNADGDWNLRAILGEQLENPLANISEITDQRNEWRLVGSVFAEFQVNDALRFKSTIGTNAHFWRNPYFAPRTVAAGASVNGSASMGTGYEREITNENTVSYHRPTGPGTLDLLGGLSVQTGEWESSGSHAENFPTDEIEWYDLGSGSSQRTVSSGYNDWGLLSMFGRANYNLRDRYLFTVTARRDGSSRFGANNKWSFFPSAAFAWRVSDEPFLRGRSPFSELKLRLSYGTTGNQAVSQYQSLARMVPVFVGIGTNTQVVTLVPSGDAPNPNLKWETTRQANIGIDAGLFDNRLSLTIDAYRSVTNDLLLWTNLPRTSGYSRQLRNVGSVQNKGVELGLSTLTLQRGSFSWRSSLNVAANRNRVLDLGGVNVMFPGAERYGWFLDGNESFVVQVGQPLGAIYGYKVTGLWQPGDACYLQPPQTADCTPGEYKVADLDGDGLITPADRTIIGYTEPKFYGGFGNNLALGPLSLDVFFNFSYGNKVANVNNVFSELATGFLNERAEVLDRWTPQNTNTMIPRANNARPRRLYSTFVEDGSFLRLQTITLAYQLPPRLLPGASTARLYLTAQNAFVLDGYSGFDPEVNSIGGDSRYRGVDAGAYPRARVVNVGISVGL